MKFEKLVGMFNEKRGQVALGPMTGVISIAFALFFIGILVFAFALAGSEMIDATTDATAISVINATVQGTQSFANFSPTLWVMLAISALLTILIIGVGGFFLMGRK